jgi:altronate hydrolase
MEEQMEAIKINESDNVAVLLKDVKEKEIIFIEDNKIKVLNDIKNGHKIALNDIKYGENIIKYGYTIGLATKDISKGEWVHTHNVKTNLGEILSYEYKPIKFTKSDEDYRIKNKTFQGYRRENEKVGIRNEIWVIPTVGCVNRIAEILADKAYEKFNDFTSIDGFFALTHPYGCSQIGDDFLSTQKILASITNHPNAAGVLILGLGCENNHIESFKKNLGNYNSDRVKFLICQDVEDELTEGLKLIEEIVNYAKKFRREEIDVSELIVGLKCGGSDGFSGITANPLIGSFSDKLIDMGGSTVLSEVPEMFGAETILMERAENEQVFKKIVSLINNFKEYFISHNQPIYENPAYGNIQGGITTLEEKSLGCTQKGGHSYVVDVIDYGERVIENGLTLLNAPGNDGVSTSALAAAGCHIILFSTGRGTPFGTIAPTIKISTNNNLYNKKSNWIDFNASRLLNGEPKRILTDELFSLVVEIASGKITKAEKIKFKEVVIFKRGVTV